MSHIASTYPSNLVQVHREPVENWMNIKGFDLLKALYTESNRWTFAFEMTALLSRIKNHTNAINNHHIHVYERSILSCFHVFIHHDRQQNYLNEVEYRILQDHFEYGLQKTMNLSQTVILYFDLSPKECLERIVKRSRQSEVTIDLKRLEQLKLHYDEFMHNFKLCPVKIIDASQSIERTYQQVDSILNQFIKQNQINDMTYNTKSSLTTEQNC
jgi:deoxyadenosine/deoxycytidine kinase